MIELLPKKREMRQNRTNGVSHGMVSSTGTRSAKSKGNRLSKGLPGTAQGVHVPNTARMTCFCGGCSTGTKAGAVR